MFLDNVFFYFDKGGGAPPDWTTEPQWFFVNNKGGGVKSLLTNVNNKMVFLMKASLIDTYVLKTLLRLCGLI